MCACVRVCEIDFIMIYTDMQNKSRTGENRLKENRTASHPSHHALRGHWHAMGDRSGDSFWVHAIGHEPEVSEHDDGWKHRRFILYFPKDMTDRLNLLCVGVCVCVCVCVCVGVCVCVCVCVCVWGREM